jgi:hypothetical protein
MEHFCFYFVYIDFHLGFICTNIYKILLECISSLYFSSELLSLLRISRPVTNVSMMQNREQLRFKSAGAMITRARAKSTGKMMNGFNKLVKNENIFDRRNSATVERQYMTPATRRADAAIQ